MPRLAQAALAWLALVCGGAPIAAVATAQPAPGGRTAGNPPATAPSAAVAAPFVFPADDRELLALDGEMRAYFAARVDARAAQETRLSQIITALLGEQGLHLAYVTDANYSARDIFHHREGNCLSFSLLAVAVAREYQLKATFCEVDTYPRWDRYGKLITEVRHLNVAIWADSNRYELDLLPVAERQTPARDAHPVSDARAFAHFYNNLGVFRLAQGAAGEAQRLFDRALAADRTAAFVWANKGSALLLTDDFGPARECFNRALHEDAQDPSTLSSLANLELRVGHLKEAAALNKKVERYRQRNPYYLCLLARAEIDRGRFREADKLLRRAIGLKNDEPEFYELRIQTAQGLGRPKDAQHWAETLQALRAKRAQTPTP